MKPDEATVKLTYDKAKDGKVSIKLRVSYKAERPRYRLHRKEPILVTPAMYKRVVDYHQNPKKNTAESIISVYSEVAPFLHQAEAIIASLPVFSFAKFEELFYHTGKAQMTPDSDVIGYLMRLYELNDAEGRIGNAESYKSAAKSMSRFVSSLTDVQKTDLLGDDGQRERTLLPFDKVTPELLNRYERWMLQFGTGAHKLGQAETPASMTTIGIYLRQVRAAFNLAIKDKLITSDTYPFGRSGFVIPTGSNTKKALKKSVIRQLMEFPCEPGSFQERGRDLWVLSYLSNGMNLSDICSLRWSDISFSDETITFIRNKTSRSRRGNQTKIVAQLFPESRVIIERWANQERTTTGYVFPFVNEQMSARQKKMTITQVINVTNKYTKLIAKELGITTEIKTYEARHSFGSALLKSGADLMFIKDKFGHGSIKTTEIYTQSILDEDEQAMMRKSLLGDD